MILFQPGFGDAQAGSILGLFGCGLVAI